MTYFRKKKLVHWKNPSLEEIVGVAFHFNLISLSGSLYLRADQLKSIPFPEVHTPISENTSRTVYSPVFFERVTAEYPARSSILSSWVRGTRYVERIKVKMEKYLK